MTARKTLLLFACVVALAPSAVRADGVTDWHKAALADIVASKQTLLDNSPGGVKGEDAEFLANIDRAADLANHDAQTVNSYAGYRFALERFANVFQDDHLWVDFNTPLPAKWPGFMLGWRHDALEIVDTTDAANAPLGATLVSCDGVKAGALADRILTPYVGRWTVPSSRREFAPSLLVDRGNPFIARPTACTFAQGARNWAVTLNWTDIASADLVKKRKAAQRIASEPEGGVRATEDGGYWVGIPTLNALNPAAVAGLETLMKDIEAKAPAIRSAKYFVIDLRGNSGGNTFVALRVLNAIWGEGAMADVRPHNLQAEWRASKDNIAYLTAVEPVLKQMFGEQSAAYTGISRIIQGFQQSVAAGRALYIDPDEYSLLDVAPGAPRYTVTAKPFLLTDGGCVSSCLNLVDLVLKLPGVTQIGDETASDTYMLENRPAPLPSGEATLEFPIKLYRHRERLKNQSYKPVKAWPGDMGDTAALEHWVATLAK